MIQSLDPRAQLFLADLQRVQSQINTAERQVSSGLKISQPSDAPEALPGLMQLRAELDRNAQVSNNLAHVKTEADSSEAALATATQIVDRSITLALQGANSIAGGSDRTAAAQEVTNLLQEMVGLSQTSVQGRYVFSGDQEDQPSYSLNLASPTGVDRLQTPATTRQISDASGVTFAVAHTAQDIFDHRNPDDTVAPDNIFAAINSLRVSLENNDQPGVATALTSLRQASGYLSTQLSFYGSVQNRIQDASDFASKQRVQLVTDLSQTQDADVAQAAIQLAQSNVQLNAALSAEAKLPRTSLFDFLA